MQTDRIFHNVAWTRLGGFPLTLTLSQIALSSLKVVIQAIRPITAGSTCDLSLEHTAWPSLRRQVRHLLWMSSKHSKWLHSEMDMVLALLISVPTTVRHTANMLWNVDQGKWKQLQGEQCGAYSQLIPCKTSLSPAYRKCFSWGNIQVVRILHHLIVGNKTSLCAIGHV